MISNYAEVRGSIAHRSIKSKIGRLGMILLGASFSIWALLLATGGQRDFSDSFVYTPFMQLLAMSTIFLTIAGLAMANIGMGAMASRLKSVSRYSTFFFVWMNIIGFYIAYNSVWGGPYFTTSQLQAFTIWTGALITFYVVSFTTFIIPLLRKRGMVFLLISGALYEIFMVLIQLSTFRSEASSPINMLPGANFPYVLVLVDPTFGFPWFQLNFAALQSISQWTYALPLAANLILAGLYFSPVLSSFRKKSDPLV